MLARASETLHRREIGRQRNRAGPRAARLEVLEQLRDRRAAASAASVGVDAASPSPAAAAPPAWPGETPDRRSAGRGYRRCVSKPSSGSSKSLVRNTASSRLFVSTCFGQSGCAICRSASSYTASQFCGVMLARRSKPKNVWHISTSQLYWIVLSQRAEVLDQPAALSPSASMPGSSIWLLRHAGRMGQLGVVVIAQDVGQRVRARIERVDVRVRIDEHKPVELVEQTFAKVEGHRFAFNRGSED